MKGPSLKSSLLLNNSSIASPSSAPVDSRLAQTIVHWQFEPQEWQRFLEFDEVNRQKQDSKWVFVIPAILALVMGVFFVLGLGEAVIGVGIFAGIIFLAIIAHFAIQRRRYQGMRLHDERGGGEVHITPEGILANGEWFDWGDATPWRLTTVTPVLAETGARLPPGSLSYLEFKCRGRVAGRRPVRVDKKWRVPVPRGKEEEARRVVQYFNKPSARRDEFGLPAD